MEDLQLLRDYAEGRSERAFTELVQRHTDFVYSTALRLVDESQLAEDVTQLVFIRLARKAPSLRDGTIVAGWLYRTTQHVAQTILRSDWRRRKRECLAMQDSEFNPDWDSSWREVAPLVEDAMGHLRPADQDAVLLRFFAGKSLREIGQALGVSDDTAQKRVNRALDRIRAYFARRGVVVPAAVLGSMLAAHTVQAAPVSFASTLAATAAVGTKTGLGFATSCKLLQAMLVAKCQAHGVGAIVAALLLFAGAVAFFQTPAGSVTATDDATSATFVLQGHVQTPDGRPLAGALVRVATPQAYVRLYQTTNTAPRTNAARTVLVSPSPTERPAPSAITGADGSFVVGLPEPPRDGLAAIVVNSEAGYGLVTAEELLESPVVVVQPWARIEGVLRIGKSAASNQTVNISIWGATELYEWNLVQHGASTKTDAKGRFVFPRVAPVDVWLTHTVMVRTNDGRPSGHHYLKVQPGDQLEVQLGGTGRALIGRVEVSPTNKLIFYGSMWANQARGIRHPRDWKTRSREEQRRYERAWRETPEAEVWKDSCRNYEFPVQPSGAFRVDDVLPGRYRLQVRADEPVPGGKGMRHAAAAEMVVDVPELLAGESDGPIDLGPLVPVVPVAR
jgi:RNA polymerase sigma factor (sigma-70 family)